MDNNNNINNDNKDRYDNNDTNNFTNNNNNVNKDIEDNKVIAALAYIIFFLPLIVAKDSEFGKFHANQGLIYFYLALL